MMRRILVDHARRHHAAKRGAAKVTLDDRIGAVKPYDCEILLLDQALRDWQVLRRVRRKSSNSDILAVFGERSRTAVVPRNGYARMAGRTNVAIQADD